jgi:hypothetical protein
MNSTMLSILFYYVDDNIYYGYNEMYTEYMMIMILIIIMIMLMIVIKMIIIILTITLPYIKYIGTSVRQC